MRRNVSSFSVGIFLFFTNQRWRPRRGTHARECQHFPQHFSFPVNPLWRLRWRTQNTFWREEEGIQGCGLGVRRAVRVEVMGLSKGRVKKGHKDKGKG